MVNCFYFCSTLTVRAVSYWFGQKILPTRSCWWHGCTKNRYHFYSYISYLILMFYWFLLFQDNLYLDMYLVPHVNTLYTQIRNRALCQVSVVIKSYVCTGTQLFVTMTFVFQMCLCSSWLACVSTDKSMFICVNEKATVALKSESYTILIWHITKHVKN